MYADPAHYAANTATLADALTRLIEDRRNRKRAAGTITMYDQKGRHICRVFGPDARLASVTAASVDGYVRTRLTEGASRHTVHKELVTLRALLKVALRHGEFSGDVSAVMPVGFSPNYEPRKTYLTPKQVDALLAALPLARSAHVAYVVATGARRAEAVKARRSDVVGQFATLHGTKTGSSARTAPIVLARHRALLKRALRDAPGDDPLFVGWGNARRDIAKACNEAKIPVVTWNDLRRTFASWLKQAGVRNEDIASLLGHVGTSMVRRVYGQDTPEALASSLRNQLGYGTLTTQSRSLKRSKRRKTKGNRKNGSRTFNP